VKTARVLALLLAVALCAACGTSTAENSATATTTTTAATTITAAPIAASTALPPTTTLIGSTAAANTEPDNASGVLTGTDWPAIVEILGRRRQDLYSTPIAEDAGYSTICAATDGGSCLEGLRTQIPSLIEQGFRIVGADPYTVLPDDVAVEDVEEGQTVDTARIVTVVVTVRRSSNRGQLVNGAGDVQADITSDTPEGHNIRTRTTLVREAPGSEWRILDQSAAGTVPA